MRWTLGLAFRGESGLQSLDRFEKNFDKVVNSSSWFGFLSSDLKIIQSRPWNRLKCES